MTVTSLTEQNARWLGRTCFKDGTVQIFWSASGFELCFEGTGLEAQLNSKPSAPDNISYINVYLDSDPVGIKMRVPAEGWLTLAGGLAPGAHTLKVVKLNGAREDTLVIGGVRIPDGGLLDPPREKARKIEFIGDSITCGVNIDRDADAPDVYTPEIENPMLTYAAVCATALDADFNCFSLSGWTIHRRGDSAEPGCVAIPPVYHQTAPVNGCTAEWDFAKFMPDVVVIALGTNDTGYIIKGQAEAQEFVDKYISFLGDLRRHYPDAAIVCTVGMMRQQPIPYIKQAIESFGDGNVYAFAETHTRNTHPIVEDNRMTGEALAGFIAGIQGW